MNKHEIRRKKLRELIDSIAGGKIAKFSQIIDKDPSYVGRMLYPKGKAGYKAIGEEMVDHILTKLNLPYGWLDHEDHEDNAYAGSGASFYNNAIKVLDVSASAGLGTINASDVKEIISAIQYTEEQYLFMFGKSSSDKIKLINIKGDSMSGTLESGDLIFVDVSVNCFDGDGIYVFLFNDHLYVKRLQMAGDRLIVISDNHQYRDWEITNTKEDEFNIAGKVLIRQSQELTRYG